MTRELPTPCVGDKQLYCGPLAVKWGEIVPYCGLEWVVTGWNHRRNHVWLARGSELIVATPASLGMQWK